MGFSERESQRYTRQMMMAGWGDAAQQRLKDATVFIAGAGGLGSPVSIYLAVAGIGNIRICDFDAPDLSNLNRQILHDDSRIGINKAVSAKQTLERLNPDIRVEAFDEKIDESSIERLVGDAVIILDCMDNFPTRYLLNTLAMSRSIPLVHGCVWGMEGRLTFIHAPETPCLQCLFPDAPPQETFPVVGATPGVIGSLQALEAVKYLTSVGDTLKNRLLVWEGMGNDYRLLKIRKIPDCPACGEFEIP